VLQVVRDVVHHLFAYSCIDIVCICSSKVSLFENKSLPYCIMSMCMCVSLCFEPNGPIVTTRI
jgi:hypothetical protein